VEPTEFEDLAVLTIWYSESTFIQRRYRLTVRTEPSQGLNTGSIPVSATKPFKINHF
jgi:hypothetical protein